MARTDDKMMIRLPDGLRDRIKAKAKENRRSANAELIFHLERIFPAEVSESPFDGAEETRLPVIREKPATTGASLQADTPAVAHNHAALAGGATINP